MTRPLVQVAEVALGRQRSPQYESGDHMTRYLRSANVADGALVLDDVKSMNFDPRDQTAFKLRRGDVLITEGSGSRATVGTSAVWLDDLPGTVCFQNTLLRVRPRHGLADGRYLAWWARHAHAAGLMANVAGGANILHLSAEEVRRLPIPDLPLDEQRRIADFLDDQVARIDNIVAARERQWALMTERAISDLRRDLLDGGSVSGADGDAFEAFPTDWSIRRLGSSWQVIDCKHRTPAYVDVGYPVLSPGDVNPGPLDPTVATRFVGAADYADLADDLRRCRKGDIVYSRNASAGTAALVVDDRPFTMGQDVCRITSDRPSQAYLYHVLNQLMEPQLERFRIGSTFTRINIAQIKSLLVPVPPYRRQIEISEAADCKLSEMDQLRRRFSDLITRFVELKRSLITAAVTGEFDVSAADGSRVPV